MVRVKRRYIVVNVSYKGSQNQEAFLKELKNQIFNIYGDFGVACLNRGFSVKKHDPKDGFFVICVRKGVEELVMSAAPMISQVNQVPCTVNIIHLSGTLRASLKELKKSYLMSIRASIAKSSV